MRIESVRQVKGNPGQRALWALKNQVKVRRQILHRNTIRSSQGVSSTRQFCVMGFLWTCQAFGINGSILQANFHCENECFQLHYQVTRNAKHGISSNTEPRNILESFLGGPSCCGDQHCGSRTTLTSYLAQCQEHRVWDPKPCCLDFCETWLRCTTGMNIHTSFQAPALSCVNQGQQYLMHKNIFQISCQCQYHLRQYYFPSSSSEKPGTSIVYGQAIVL